MVKTKILVLGNDPQINQIDFDRLDPSVITYGVNRIWLRHIPNYFFFHDKHIFKELLENPEKLAQLQMRSKVFTSDWLKLKHREVVLPNWIRCYPRIDRYQFVDSVTTGLQILCRNIYSPNNIRFYIAGVSLIWREPSHFWKETEYRSYNQFGPAWYGPRFDRTFANFEKLKTKGFDMVSVNPDSKLNKILRYENISNLYKKS